MSRRGEPGRRVGVFLSGFWIALAALAPGLVGRAAAYPLLVLLLVVALLVRSFVLWRRGPRPFGLGRDLYTGLLLTFFVGLPVLAVIAGGVEDLT